MLSPSCYEIPQKILPLNIHVPEIDSSVIQFIQVHYFKKGGEKKFTKPSYQNPHHLPVWLVVLILTSGVDSHMLASLDSGLNADKLVSLASGVDSSQPG